MKTTLSALALLCLAPALLTACKPGEQPAPEPQADAPPAATPAPPAPTSSFAALELADPARMMRVPCAVDKINTQRAANQVVNLETGADARFVGWVSDPSRRVPATFKIVLKGAADAYGADARADRPRPDVARTLKSGALANAGYNNVVSLAGVAPGEYEVGLMMGSGDNQAYCRTPARVVVMAAAG